jgi:hypothetical protein
MAREYYVNASQEGAFCSWFASILFMVSRLSFRTASYFEQNLVLVGPFLSLSLYIEEGGK